MINLLIKKERCNSWKNKYFRWFAVSTCPPGQVLASPDMSKVRVLVQFCMFRVQKWYFDEIYKWFCMAFAGEAQKHFILSKDHNIEPKIQNIQTKITKKIHTNTRFPKEPCGAPAGDPKCCFWEVSRRSLGGSRSPKLSRWTRGVSEKINPA